METVELLLLITRKKIKLIAHARHCQGSAQETEGKHIHTQTETVCHVHMHTQTHAHMYTHRRLLVKQKNTFLASGL